MIPINIIDVTDKNLSVTRMRALCAYLKQNKYKCFIKQNKNIIINELNKVELQYLLNDIIKESGKNINDHIIEYNNQLTFNSNNIIISTLSTMKTCELRKSIYHLFNYSNAHKLSKKELIDEFNKLLIAKYGNNISIKELTSILKIDEIKKVIEIKEETKLRKQTKSDKEIEKYYSLIKELMNIIDSPRVDPNSSEEVILQWANKTMNDLTITLEKYN